jgi:hypothetical protein
VNAHVHIPSRDEILPGGKDPWALAEEARLRRAALLRGIPFVPAPPKTRPYAPSPIKVIAHVPQPEPVAEPEPEPIDESQVDLTANTPDAIRVSLKRMRDMRNVCLPIMEAVTTIFRVSENDIVSERRDAPTVKARHAFFYLCKVLTFASLPRIGRHCGSRDHTSVLHGYRRVDQIMRANGIVISQYTPPIDAARIVNGADWNVLKAWENAGKKARALHKSPSLTHTGEVR